MEFKKRSISLASSNVIEYYLYSKLNESQCQEFPEEVIEIPALKEATLREDGIVSVESVKRMSEIIAEQAKLYAAAIRSGIRTPLLIEETVKEETTENAVESQEETSAPVEDAQPEEPVVNSIEESPVEELPVEEPTADSEELVPETTDEDSDMTTTENEDVVSDDNVNNDMYEDSVYVPTLEEAVEGPLDEYDEDEDEDDDDDYKGGLNTQIPDNSDNEYDEDDDAPIATGIPTEVDADKNDTMMQGDDFASETTVPANIAEAAENESQMTEDTPVGFTAMGGFSNSDESANDKPFVAPTRIPLNKESVVGNGTQVSGNANYDNAEMDAALTALPKIEPEKIEPPTIPVNDTIMPVMEQTVELHKLDKEDEEDESMKEEFASISDFLKTI